MTRIEPALRDTETYTHSNFLRVYTAASGRAPHGAAPDTRLATIEHLFYRPEPGVGGWRCTTVVDNEPMTRDDALFIAQAYAREHGVPVIYESHATAP